MLVEKHRNYQRLLESDYSKETRVFGTDQKAINLFFEDQIIATPNIFNTLISEVEFVRRADIIFLHYIYKPYRPDFMERTKHGAEFLKLWKKYEAM